MARPGRGDRSVYATATSVINNLPDSVASKRAAEGLSLRQAAEQIGIPYSSVFNLEAGRSCRADTIVAVLRWLSS